MSHPLPPTKLALRRNLAAVRQKLAELEVLMLELNRHPDVTMDMLRESHETHIRLSSKLRELEGRLES